ncbi:MAG: hypothetical protein KME13_11390 [Myxacorys californica WJT36-NPBG1]|jgi:hypothetical protein|nr:hypothetical protein [Myxacorys californica WJT36-NPBG1]
MSKKQNDEPPKDWLQVMKDVTARASFVKGEQDAETFKRRTGREPTSEEWQRRYDQQIDRASNPTNVAEEVESP